MIIITILLIIVLCILLKHYYIIRSIRQHIIRIQGSQPDILDNLYSTKFKKRFITSELTGKLSGVDMVYCIVMPQRKEYITEQINKLNVQCKYFDAVKPFDLENSDYDYMSTINYPGSRIYNKFTRLPVLLSFVMCFIDSIINNYSTIIVFEDDIEIKVDLDTLNKSIDEFNKSKYDIFYMGYCYLNCKQSPKQTEYLVDVPDKSIVCCHAMCIKTHFLLDMIKYCFPMTRNSDELFRNYYIENLINVCVPKYAYFTQNRTSIQSLNESYDELKTCKF